VVVECGVAGLLLLLLLLLLMLLLLMLMLLSGQLALLPLWLTGHGRGTGDARSTRGAP